jgi:hypothetical protein
MAYLIDAGIQISLGQTALGAVTTDPAEMVWYKLTDHNREPIQVSTEIIESANRMANGTMRKYVIAQKNKISVSWKYVPSIESGTNGTVDGYRSVSWIESFYHSNSGLPIYLKVVSSGFDSTLGTARIDQPQILGSVPIGTFVTSQVGFQLYRAYMTDFSKTIINRTKISDYVDMSIEFTEI